MLVVEVSAFMYARILCTQKDLCNKNIKRTRIIELQGKLEIFQMIVKHLLLSNNRQEETYSTRNRTLNGRDQKRFQLNILSEKFENRTNIRYPYKKL